jgi:hypothetical protein
MFSRALSCSYTLPSSGWNFWMVVNTTPPLATFNNSFRWSRSSACTGSCRNNCCTLAKVSKSWSSRSLRSVMTTMVGLSNASTTLPV